MYNIVIYYNQDKEKGEILYEDINAKRIFRKVSCVSPTKGLHNGGYQNGY